MAYFIKRPSKTRRTFALISPQGKTIKDDRIERLNQDVLSGLSPDLAEHRIQEIKSSFEKQYRPPRLGSLENIRIAHSLHRKKIARKPNLRDPRTLETALYRACDVLGSLNIHTASEDEILVCLRGKTPMQQHYLRRDINQMLAFIGRPFRLLNPKPVIYDPIARISLVDFQKKYHEFGDTHRMYLSCLFATGARYGELPSIAPLGSVEVGVAITSQVLRTGEWAPTKNRVVREVPTIPAFKQELLQWLMLSEKEKIRIRLEEQRKMFDACKDVLGIRIHDLRHSYAIYLRTRGFNHVEIAAFIGDTVETCKRHYLREGGATEAIKLASARLSPDTSCG